MTSAPAEAPAQPQGAGCGGRAEKAELLTGIEAVSSRPLRKIGLRAE